MPTEVEIKIAIAIHALRLVRWNGARHLTVTNQFVAAGVLQDHLAVIARSVTARMLLRPKHKHKDTQAHAKENRTGRDTAANKSEKD
jgi:hypothetical protein